MTARTRYQLLLAGEYLLKCIYGLFQIIGAAVLLRWIFWGIPPF